EAAGGESIQAETQVIEIPPRSKKPTDPQLEQFWQTVRRLPKYVLLATNLMRDPRVPKSVKARIGIGGAYTISPIDLVPGIIPVAGQLDDLLVLLISLRQATRNCPPEVAEEHLSRAGLTLADFDNDLRTTRDTAIRLARKGVRAAGRLATAATRRLRAAIGRDG